MSSLRSSKDPGSTEPPLVEHVPRVRVGPSYGDLLRVDLAADTPHKLIGSRLLLLNVIDGFCEVVGVKGFSGEGDPEADAPSSPFAWAPAWACRFGGSAHAGCRRRGSQIYRFAFLLPALISAPPLSTEVLLMWRSVAEPEIS